MTTATAKFEDNFWGEGNHGFEVLLQNFKAQSTASKELAEYIKERALVEDGYVKSLSKLHKTVSAVPETQFGAFIPMWKLVKDTNDQLATIHSQFCKMLYELAREITEYNIAQKDKLKTGMKGDIDSASDSLIVFGNLDGQLQRTKKQYQHGAEHLAKAQEKFQRALADPSVNPKTKQHLESKAKQAHTWMETMKADHQAAVKRQCEHMMEFQGKMKEACMKFEALEEEHLAQMSTFMLKLARSQNSTLVNIEQHYAAFNSHLDDLSVEKLLLEFVQAKGTGTEKPTPYKFRRIEIDVPPISLSASSEDVRGSSPTPGGNKNTSRGEKSIINRFKKRKPKAVSNGPIEEHPQSENAPEVDEEGFSIRPDNAASISQFPDEPSFSRHDSDSDSDFDDDEPESRIKNIKIKEKTEQPQATVDELKASVMSLRLGTTSPGIKKATSTHSLDALATPPITKRNTSSSTKQQTDDSKSVSSLLDLDDIIIGQPPTLFEPSVVGGGASALPPPLLPSSLFSSDPMATLTPMSLQPLSTQSSALPSSSVTSSILAPTTITISSSTNPVLDPGISSLNSRPIPKPRDSTLKASDQQNRKDLFSAFEEEAKDQPSSLPFNPSGNVPPLPNKKKNSTGTVPSTSSQTSTAVVSGATTSSNVTKSPSGYSVLSISSEKAVDSFTPFEANFGSGNSASLDDVQHGNVPTIKESGDQTGSLSAGSSPKLSSKFPKSTSKERLSSTETQVAGILPPPLPMPRRGAMSSRRRSGNPPPGTDLVGHVSSPLATAKVAAPRSSSTSPISFISGTTSTTTTTAKTNGLTTSPPHTSPSPTMNSVPIAVAVQETCNAIFKGNDPNKCVIKVNGEVMVSFPANYIAQLASHDVLAFKLTNTDNVERLLHNQHLLKKEGDDYLYKFDMPALLANLKQIREKQNSLYCNIQILKYEVKASSGTQLPLKLVSFWKCEPNMTNFRLDYLYQPHSLKQLKKPAMTNISVVVPVSGGVRKSLSKPEGSWVAEQNKIMWKVGDLQPSEEGRGTLHAKFDVANGPTVPAPATVQFLCDGATMSGLNFELSSDAYKISLMKNKCISGKYIAEIVHHY